ncbi:hypothetical protein GUJ93_ZPchr0003g16846 [Zizania palustris]|uniref:Uncharacterized protein n=1 Tax=Zizania palustris TaxID=103762 RepID=A0A8J5S389_ZIZPA|nr:hypothetical protein GUJ93_ZPchr0003g16846 [Zizania palustris]
MLPTPRLYPDPAMPHRSTSSQHARTSGWSGTRMLGPSSRSIGDALAPVDARFALLRNEIHEKATAVAPWGEAEATKRRRGEAAAVARGSDGRRGAGGARRRRRCAGGARHAKEAAHERIRSTEPKCLFGIIIYDSAHKRRIVHSNNAACIINRFLQLDSDTIG